MHPSIIIGTVRSLWTWLWGRYHVPQNAFLVLEHAIDGEYVNLGIHSPPLNRMDLNVIRLSLSVMMKGKKEKRIKV